MPPGRMQAKMQDQVLESQGPCGEACKVDGTRAAPKALQVDHDPRAGRREVPVELHRDAAIRVHQQHVVLRPRPQHRRLLGGGQGELRDETERLQNAGGRHQVAGPQQDVEIRELPCRQVAVGLRVETEVLVVRRVVQLDLAEASRRLAGRRVRVAVVVEFGLRAIAPKGENVQPTIRKCVSIKPGTNGLEILNKVVSVRTSADGFVCGLNNYPAKECSTEILTPKSLQKK